MGRAESPPFLFAAAECLTLKTPPPRFSDPVMARRSAGHPGDIFSISQEKRSVSS
jgi:hypothetical protein